MKFIRCFIIICYFNICLFMGCQSTPNNTPVVQKIDLEKIVFERSCPFEEYQYNETWKESWNIGKSSITINAAIYVPDVNSFPVDRVTSVGYETDYLLEFMDYFASDNQWYYDWIFSKEQLEDQLMGLKANKWKDDQHVLKDRDSYIEDFSKRITTAISDEERDVFKDFDLNNVNSLSLETTNGNGELIRFFYDNTNDDVQLYISKGNLLLTREVVEFNKEEFGGIKANKEDAVKKGNQVIKELGKDCLYLATIEEAYLYGHEEFAPLKYKGFLLTYLRKNEGLETLNIGDGVVFNINNMPDFTTPWIQERVRIFVDEHGVQSFDSYGNIKIVKRESENVKLLSFEEVKDRIKKQLGYKLAWSEEYKDVKSLACVDKITLGLALSEIKDNKEEAFLIPAWYIPYNEVVIETVDGITYEDYYEDALVLNAMDGSVLEPRMPPVNAEAVSTE